jgi:Tol biopolymer transport system component
MVVLSCSKGGRQTGFAYKISADKKYPDIQLSYDNVRISSKGSYIVWGQSPDVVKITDLLGTAVTTLPNNYVSHFDVITDEDGEEVLVGRANGASGTGQDGLVNKYRLRDGKRTVLGKIGWSYHTSSRALKTHRYCVSASADEGGSNQPGEAEIFLMNLDGSVAYRLCHHHIPRNIDYVAETQPSHSPDGGRVIFASAWGTSGSTPRPVGCYVVDFRT